MLLTPAALRATGAINKTIELAKKHGWFMTRQFENEANPDYHAKTTGPEIIEDFKTDGLDYFVTGYGTGGTLNGVARVLAKQSPRTKVVVREPTDAPMLTSGVSRSSAMTTVRPRLDTRHGSRIRCRAGLRLHPEADGEVDLSKVHKILTITAADAMKCSMDLAQKEGVFVGITSGATFAGALEVAKTAPKGSNILAMLPDTGERYLSTPLFANTPAEMTPEEIDIMKSTPYAAPA